MFDNKYDDRPVYYSTSCSINRGVIIKFVAPVQYHDVQIYTRTRCCRNRYKRLCLYAHGIKVSCTTDLLTDVGSPIRFKLFNKVTDPVIATEYRLMWDIDDPNEHCAQIEELFFDYIGTPEAEGTV